MESTLSTTTSLLSMAKTLNPSPNPFVSRLHRQLPSTRPGPFVSLKLRRLFTAEFRRPKPLNSVPYSSNSLRSLCAVGVHRLGCVGSSAASFASVSGGGGGGGGGIGGSGGGGGDGASDGGEAESNSVVGGAEEVSALSPDVIILDVGVSIHSLEFNL
ncbi:hypothetical protein Acr_06g0010800 [Actinidia rufa]|uniref:Uncharacterized protein n=1 Tax=Actinidia rufa TaxID=165716 RepID=A0A7J0ES44_9ERIC|nr:hypothetical protein Acr_06g0010800 [Actinidia rufa]